VAGLIPCSLVTLTECRHLSDRTKLMPYGCAGFLAKVEPHLARNLKLQVHLQEYWRRIRLHAPTGNHNIEDVIQ
jgi:hypothetical protein